MSPRNSPCQWLQPPASGVWVCGDRGPVASPQVGQISEKRRRNFAGVRPVSVAPCSRVLDTRVPVHQRHPSNPRKAILRRLPKKLTPGRAAGNHAGRPNPSGWPTTPPTADREPGRPDCGRLLRTSAARLVRPPAPTGPAGSYGRRLCRLWSRGRGIFNFQTWPRTGTSALFPRPVIRDPKTDHH